MKIKTKTSCLSWSLSHIDLIAFFTAPLFTYNCGNLEEDVEDVNLYIKKTIVDFLMRDYDRNKTIHPYIVVQLYNYTDLTICNVANHFRNRMIHYTGTGNVLKDTKCKIIIINGIGEIVSYTLKNHLYVLKLCFD